MRASTCFAVESWLHSPSGRKENDNRHRVSAPHIVPVAAGRLNRRNAGRGSCLGSPQAAGEPTFTRNQHGDTSAALREARRETGVTTSLGSSKRLLRGEDRRELLSQYASLLLLDIDRWPPVNITQELTYTVLRPRGELRKRVARRQVQPHTQDQGLASVGTIVLGPADLRPPQGVEHWQDLMRP